VAGAGMDEQELWTCFLNLFQSLSCRFREQVFTELVLPCKVIGYYQT
jgi:hypothetical protein